MRNTRTGFITGSFFLPSVHVDTDNGPEFKGLARYRGMSAERIYNLIEEQQDQDGSSREQENPEGAAPDGESEEQPDKPDADGELTAPATPGGFGQVLDAPEPAGDDGATVAEQAREWKIALEQAENVAKLAGKLPAGATRSLEQSEAAGVDWRELLRRAWSETIPSDYSWMPPNRRHIWAGLYLPGVRSEGTGEIAIAVDCSGSVSARQLGLFEAEIRSILEGQRPSRVHVLYFDTEVHKGRRISSGAADHAYSNWRRRNELRAVLHLVGRARNCAADLGFPYRLMWRISGKSSCLPSVVGLHGVASSAFRQVIPMEAA